MSKMVRIELTKKEWLAVSTVMASFDVMFGDYLKGKPLEFPLVFHQKMQDIEFQYDIMSTGHQLRILASKTIDEELPTGAAPQRHGTLVPTELEKVEFLVLWNCWRAMIILLRQSIENQELRIPVEVRSIAEHYEQFGRDFSKVLDKLPLSEIT